MNLPIVNNFHYFKIVLILIFGISLTGCKENTDSKLKDETETNMKLSESLNLLNKITSSDLGDFLWINEPEEYSLDSGKLMITAPEKSDFFNDPESKSITSTAPLLYKNIKGDFVATALVTPSFEDVWNACALMVYIDSMHWIKFAFENSDATGNSIVSVVTNIISDDANGVILENYNSIWLRMIRKNNNYSMLWSADGSDYKMSRLATLPYSETVKLGLEAQCPAGQGASHTFDFFSIDHKTVEKLRTGL